MTRAAAILDFIGGVRGTLHVTFEEGTHSAWLYDLLSRRVAKLVVCNPRKNALLKSGNKSDAIDARKLAELLRADMLSPVYHGEKSALEVQHLARSYAMLTEDTTRVMGRIKAVFRGQAMSLRGQEVIREAASRRVSGAVRNGRSEAARRVSLSGVGGCAAAAPPGQARDDCGVPQVSGDQAGCSSVPFLGPVRAAVLIGRVQTPHRFRTKRQFWAYCGLALEMRDSGEYRMVDGQVERRKRPAQIRGLNWNHNHELKNLFKAAATTASFPEGVFREFYLGLLKKNMRPEMARLTLARKIAAIALKIWKKGEAFDAEHLKLQAA
jgi:transposase